MATTPKDQGILSTLRASGSCLLGAVVQVAGAICSEAVKPIEDEKSHSSYAAYTAFANEDGGAETPSTTAPSTPITLSRDRLGFLHGSNGSFKQEKVKVAIMKYQFGNYDYKGIDDKWRIPKFEDYEVQGFFYANEGVLSQQDVAAMEAYGWKAVIVELEPGTPYVASSRVTTKKHKFCVPAELRSYDFVITHDCDVEANYRIAIPYMLGLIEERGNAALFQQHERGLSTLEEIDLFLGEKAHRISTSREKVIEWKGEVEEMIQSQRYDLSGPAYIKGNCFAFRPNDAAFLRAGQRIFEKCLIIQRDQFIMPWAVQEEHVNYSLVSQPELEANGFAFPVLLRDARTGVFN